MHAAAAAPLALGVVGKDRCGHCLAATFANFNDWFTWLEATLSNPDRRLLVAEDDSDQSGQFGSIVWLACG
jgi:hypothetical protein